MVSDVAQVYELWRDFADALNTGDFERWISLWVDDGIRLQPSEIGQRQFGKDEIQAAAQPLFDTSNLSASINIEEVQILGKRAYSYGTYEGKVVSLNGEDTFVMKGGFLTILAKQADGSWKIAIECFNT